MVFSDLVGGDDGKAREQVRRCGLVAQQLREAQALGEMGLAVADRHAMGHRHVPAELPQGEHFQAPITHRACRCRSFGKVASCARPRMTRARAPASRSPARSAASSACMARAAESVTANRPNASSAADSSARAARGQSPAAAACRASDSGWLVSRSAARRW